MAKGDYEIDPAEASEVICDGCPHVKMTHSGFHAGETMQIEPAEYDCPLHFDFKPEFDKKNLTLTCAYRSMDEF